MNPEKISDGIGETIMLVVADVEHAVPWTKPEDLQIDPQNPAAGLLRTEPEGLKIAPQDPAAGPEGAEPADAEIDPKDAATGLMDPNRYFVVARADGSAELLLADIDAATLWSFFTRAGGEKTEWPKRPKIEWKPPGTK